MRRYAGLAPLLLLFLLLLFAPEARADGLAITNGSINFNSIDGGLFSLSGQGLTVSGGIDFAPFYCVPCTSGQAINLSFNRVGGDIRAGSAVVDGVTYDQLFYEADMRMHTDSFFVPDDSSSVITLTVPFTFSASMLGCTESTTASPCLAPVFSTMLTGQGLATLQLYSYLFDSGQRVYEVKSVSYNFGTGAPVPEPATLILLGTGLAGLAAARRRKSLSRPKSED